MRSKKRNDKERAGQGMPAMAYSSMTAGASKPIGWIGSSRKDLQAFPAEVQHTMGQALRSAQDGGKHPAATPMKGFGGASVLEITDDEAGSTYRVVYTVRFPGIVYVLDAFKKKSKKGISTPKPDLDRIRDRLDDAEQEYQEWQQARGSP